MGLGCPCTLVVLPQGPGSLGHSASLFRCREGGLCGLARLVVGRHTESASCNLPSGLQRHECGWVVWLLAASRLSCLFGIRLLALGGRDSILLLEKVLRELSVEAGIRKPSEPGSEGARD
ncbi:unnamed protein product [Rangifer tarandus platyrhynchus]|uniref:Uncharacterized protein n=2 Tax=Rangifer tarandus platyrhynchus TaxID=3082113 RepID=A0AC59YFP0_RANTA|nr:unnamed protein product [Rangifer tarandus platyrhynchus]